MEGIRLQIGLWIDIPPEEMPLIDLSASFSSFPNDCRSEAAVPSKRERKISALDKQTPEPACSIKIQLIPLEDWQKRKT